MRCGWAAVLVLTAAACASSPGLETDARQDAGADVGLDALAAESSTAVDGPSTPDDSPDPADGTTTPSDAIARDAHVQPPDAAEDAARCAMQNGCSTQTDCFAQGYGPSAECCYPAADALNCPVIRACPACMTPCQGQCVDYTTLPPGTTHCALACWTWGSSQG